MEVLAKVKLCECGCGLPTSIAKHTDRRDGYIKGQPVRFIRGHSARVQLRQDPIDRYWSQVDKEGPIVRSELGPCWLWTGAGDLKGYGRIRINGRQRRATHVALELAGWILPFEWSQVLHRCDNPPCVRPDHLRIGTAQDDADDKVAKGRQAHGERNRHAKLNPTEVLEIRALHQPGVRGLGYRTLAKRFGVTTSTIGSIIRGKTWNVEVPA